MSLVMFPLLIYTILLVLLSVTLFRTSHQPQSSVIYNVSIVIPFRDEESNLPGLLQSLSQQNYQGKIEIILVNDNSTDSSVESVERIQNKFPHKIILLHSIFDTSKKLSSKQQALDLGIRHATNNWIALTDADMRLEPDWLNSLVKNVTNDCGMVFGHTSLLTKNLFFHKMQSFQLDFLFAAAFTLHKAGIGSSCMGNNLLISKEAYLSIDGYNSIGYSIVEDRALMNQLKRNKYRIHATNPFHPSGRTFPSASWNEFQHQIHRWATGGFDWKSNLLPIGMLFLFQNMVFILGIFQLFPSLVLNWTWLNFLLTWCFVLISFKKIRASHSALWFPLYYVFLQFEALSFITGLLMRRQIIWKGRKI